MAWWNVHDDMGGRICRQGACGVRWRCDVDGVVLRLVMRTWQCVSQCGVKWKLMFMAVGWHHVVSRSRVVALRPPLVSMDPRPLEWSCPMLLASWAASARWEKRATTLAVHMLTFGEIKCWPRLARLARIRSLFVAMLELTLPIALRMSPGASAAGGGHVIVVDDACAK
eukprot:461584-Amphidinium_carterae.1